MRILFVSSEVAPFAKTGGLGDVGAALPRALRAAGHDVRVVLPFYARVAEGGHEVRPTWGALEHQLGPHRLSFTTLEGTLPGTDVPVYFVHCPRLYMRPSIYTMDVDEHLRFALLGWAALRIAQQLRFAPDIAHVNDWQSALVPLTLRSVLAWDRLFERTRTVLTLHNVGHQGTFGAHVLSELGLEAARGMFHQDELGAGRLSFLLHGILYANAITTVSPTYAREITTPEQGVGLDGYLRGRADVLFGILNGIDGREWSPTHDPYLPHRYTADDLSGKARCAEELSRRVRLPHRPGIPRIGMVSRLTWQKGLDLCFEVLPWLLARHDAQLVVLGSGERKYEDFFARLAHLAPDRVAFANTFSEPLAHLIEAGSDMFLMPSRYEPCGLNQMYSLAYGTPPIVHRTGGLADTVQHFDRRTGRGNGFAFEHFDARGLAWALDQALSTYDDPTAWRRLVDNGMREDFTWDRRVAEYEAVYAKLVPEAAR
ncbi:MAG: glycogen synthase GlgA [Sandaracinaceae bacterium]|nr:glycogen synthase GlgA [Sandaracinaceae bacterium]